MIWVPVLILVCSPRVFGDVSHLFPFPAGLGLFQQPPIYPPPNTVYGQPTNEFFLPEVIVNRKNVNFSNQLGTQEDLPTKNPNLLIVYDQAHQKGYDYHEPSTTQHPSVIIPPVHLPPVEDDVPPEDLPQPEENQPSDGYNYIPPAQPTQPKPQPEPPLNSYLPPFDSRTAKDSGRYSVRTHIHEMRCLQTENGYFKAVLKVESSLPAFPIVDHDTVDNKCDLKFAKNYLIMNVPAEDFSICGVKLCGQNLCLRIRFPAISGMKTSFDSILTLQCKTQERVIAKTHAVKVGVANDVQSRSIGTYAQGGSQQQFRTHIEILRKTTNGFTKHLEPNGAVQLGEELLLRAHVIAGDGWNYTKLTDVNLQRIGKSGEVLSTANLIAPTGCSNPSMRAICPFAPTFDPPLGHRLLFKAVMFQGMKSGDEIIMSLKVSGCLEHHDCHVNHNSCDLGVARLKRSADRERNGTEFEEISKISFRVNMSDAMTEGNIRDSMESFYIIGGSCGFIGFLCLVGLIAFFRS